LPKKQKQTPLGTGEVSSAVTNECNEVIFKWLCRETAAVDEQSLLTFHFLWCFAYFSFPFAEFSGGNIAR
jgi:hypothetical protein